MSNPGQTRNREEKKLENRTIADQHIHPALACIADRPHLFSRQGSVAVSWRRRGARVYGPYYRLIYREESRQRSLYLGRVGALVEEVRQRLATMQAPRRARRLAEQRRRQAAAALRASKAHVNLGLRAWGLRLQGFEVRGWRKSPLRATFRAARREIARLRRTVPRWPRLPGIGLPRLPGPKWPPVTQCVARHSA